MGKIGAFILSFTILIQSFSFEIGDMYKISTFVNHVNSHINNGDNFADFIDLHYGYKSNSHQNKHKEHKELPFKHQHTDAQMQLVFVLNNINFNLKTSEFVFQNKNFNYKEPFSNQFVFNFFQPPQK
ncbi:hypothetical protein [Lutibacter sp.]|uniref:hypothetical protein n=1 Tax=Lutibacter sp. TaxID=1925666 RepID=UPI003564E926